MRWGLEQASYPGVIEQGEEAVRAAGALTDLTITPRGEPGRDAYKLVLALSADGKLLDETTDHLGRQTDLSRPYSTRTGKVFGRDYVKQGAYIRATYLVLSTAKFASEDEALADFEKQLDEMARFVRYVTYMIDLRDFEVLPGVLDFALLDRCMDAAADRGMSLTIRVAHIDKWGEYTWQPYYRQYNFDGAPVYEHFYGGFSVPDELYTSLWHRAYRALHARYQRHPGFQGYYLMQPAGEFTVSDKPYEGIVSGYDPATAAGFRRWLREHENLTLAQLNQRWATAHQTWDSVQPPLPNFALGRTPDLSMPWADFSRYKGWLEREGWFPIAARRIREYDPNHVIIIYGRPDWVEGLADRGHNGGNQFLQLEGKFIDTWEKHRTGWIAEPHHPRRWAAYGDPSERGWVLDWSIWVMTAQAGAGGANLHVYFDPRPGRLAARYGTDFAFDRLQKYIPILEELHTMRLVTRPTEVAVMQDFYTLWCKHRTVFWPRTEDLKRWFELLELDSVRHEGFDAEHLANYKLILPNLIDEVMSDTNIAHLDKAVRQHGAKLIIAAKTGSYCPERGKEPFALLRQLGIAPPQGGYEMLKENVMAKATADGLLLPANRDLHFFSLADLRRDTQSKEIREKFWRYPYRWIPLIDYFGYYPKHQAADGQVLARFDDGGAALSRHQVGRGEVLVFWGTPDIRPKYLKGMMARAATWAGVSDPAQGAAIPHMLEGHSESLGRRYVLLYHETPGTYAQAFPATPDGKWFVEDLVADQKLGAWTGTELREGKLPITYVEGCSPLKIYRLTSAAKMPAKWRGKYRQVQED